MTRGMSWLSIKLPGKLGRPISRQLKITRWNSARVYWRPSTLITKQRAWLQILWLRKCSTQTVAKDRRGPGGTRGLGIVFCWSRIFCMNIGFRIFCWFPILWHELWFKKHHCSPIWFVLQRYPNNTPCCYQGNQQLPGETPRECITDLRHWIEVKQRTWLLIRWSRKCSTQIVTVHGCSGLSRIQYCFLLITYEFWFSNILSISNSFTDHPDSSHELWNPRAYILIIAGSCMCYFPSTRRRCWVGRELVELLLQGSSNLVAASSPSACTEQWRLGPGLVAS